MFLRSPQQRPLTPLRAQLHKQAGGAAETFFSSIVHLTRFLGTEYPFLTLTVTEKTFLQSLTFTHYHNHNPGFPTNPDYDVQLQLDSGSGFVDIGGLLNLSSANNGSTDTITVNTTLNPGTYTLRWMPRNLNGGTDTNTEFFAMDNLVITGRIIRPVPSISLWSGSLLALLLLAFGSWMLRLKRKTS